MSNENQQPGFEHKGTFYPWAATAFGGKDLILIDRITGMALDEFEEVTNDQTSSMRGVTLLALMAISIRAKYPQWSPERIYRMILDLDLDDVEFIGGDEEPEGKPDVSPPRQGGEQPPSDSPTSDSPSDESSSSAIPPAPLTSETSVVTRP